ncbi:MAG: 2-phospho-L-lactate transferase [Gammaproteobacteria bacterium]|nr:2-phospho-L-lactate transferase [Gammaproteobacteria bacterium]
MSEVGAAQVLAISGGIGGAKLALGLYRVLGADELIVVANTGDDFEHLGLHVSPDVDTLMYTFAGINNRRTGWGREDETWTFMDALGQLGGETWFRLGDGDLATNVERTRRLKSGESLTGVTQDFTSRLGIHARLVPMTDDPVRTMVETIDGQRSFQHYFVKESCVPAVVAFRFDGAQSARLNPVFLEALNNPGLRVVVICPSNPFISIDPILAVPGVRNALIEWHGPVVAVSPIIGGRSIKGPTAKMMNELGLPATAGAVATHYGELIDGFVLDTTDSSQANNVEIPTLCTNTLMKNLEDRETLARDVLNFAEQLRQESGVV